MSRLCHSTKTHLAPPGRVPAWPELTRRVFAPKRAGLLVDLLALVTAPALDPLIPADGRSDIRPPALLRALERRDLGGILGRRRALQLHASVDHDAAVFLHALLGRDAGFALVVERATQRLALVTCGNLVDLYAIDHGHVRQNTGGRVFGGCSLRLLAPFVAKPVPAVDADVDAVGRAGRHAVALPCPVDEDLGGGEGGRGGGAGMGERRWTIT